MRRTILCVMICAGLLACAWAQPAKPTATKADLIAAAENELLKAESDFSADWQKNGADAWVRWFAPFGVEDNGGNPAVGPEAVKKSITEAYGAPGSTLMWAADEARAMEDGRMGFTRGHFVASFLINGQKKEIRGQYITIWRKQKDGNWRIIWDGGEPL